MLCLCVCGLGGSNHLAAAAVVLSLGCCCRLEADRGAFCGFGGGIGGSAALRCIRNIIEEDVCIVCELGRVGAFLEDTDFGQLLCAQLECVVAALNRGLVVVGLRICAQKSTSPETYSFSVMIFAVSSGFSCTH